MIFPRCDQGAMYPLHYAIEFHNLFTNRLFQMFGREIKKVRKRNVYGTENNVGGGKQRRFTDRN